VTVGLDMGRVYCDGKDTCIGFNSGLAFSALLKI